MQRSVQGRVQKRKVSWACRWGISSVVNDGSNIEIEKPEKGF